MASTSHPAKGNRNRSGQHFTDFKPQGLSPPVVPANVAPNAAQAAIDSYASRYADYLLAYEQYLLALPYMQAIHLKVSRKDPAEGIVSFGAIPPPALDPLRPQEIQRFPGLKFMTLPVDRLPLPFLTVAAAATPERRKAAKAAAKKRQRANRKVRKALLKVESQELALKSATLTQKQLKLSAKTPHATSSVSQPAAKQDKGGANKRPPSYYKRLERRKGARDASTA